MILLVVLLLCLSTLDLVRGQMNMNMLLVRPLCDGNEVVFSGDDCT